MTSADAKGSPRDGVAALTEQLVHKVAAACKLTPESIDIRERFSHYGLDSLGAIRLMAELSQSLGRTLSPTLVWEHPTLAALAAHLAGEAPGTRTGARSAVAPLGEMTARPGALEPTTRYDAQEPIAIIGLSCRLPKAQDAQAFWRLLRDGVDAVSEVPAARGWEALLSARGVDPAERATVRRGAFLDRLDLFEPAFFGISPREALSMDPQQRLLLELCWEALEDAGLPPGSLKGSATGVFAGAIWSDYETVLYRAAPTGLGPFTCAGSHRSIIANRISYVLGLEGPSFTLDSACSSGLVVVHLACDSLRRGESSLALAGAVNLNVLPESALAVARFGALSPEGRCYSFDARASGYVRGEGGGLIVLKTLSRAIADGDPIRALILGSAVNNDGASNGLTAPSRAAQESVLRAAYRRAGVPTDEVQYVEAHGTGTPLGDPIEARALGAVLGAGRSDGAPLYIGSAKTNVGHLEAAAGIVGLIKTTLALQHRTLPPSLNFVTPNPNAPLAELGLAVPTAARPWPAPERPLIAGVSSFGFGGTNSHVVLKEWPAPVSRAAPAISATPPQPDEAAASGVVFVFPGQGAQWHGMARSLLQCEPVFRATIEACDRHIRRYGGWSLLDELTAPREASRLDEIEVSLPSIIAIDIATSALWRSLGIEPAAVVGHSTGEIAAAHVAGALDLDDTMRIICAYGRFVGRFAGRSGMAFLGLPWDAAAAALSGFEGRVFRAIEDSAEGTVVAGEPAALTELLAALSARGVFCRPVSMNVGPHSPLVDPVRDELLASLAGIRPRRGRVPLISEVTGAELDGERLDPAHWVRNFGDPAFFSRAIDELIRRGHRLFLDVGPHPITRHSIEANLRRAGCGRGTSQGGAVLSSLRRDEDGRTTLREALVALRQRGVTARAETADDATAGAWLLPLSARGAQALVARARELAESLRSDESTARLADVVYTASVRREHHAHRLAVVGRSRDELIAELSAFAAGEPTRRTAHGQLGWSGPPKRVLAFSGQGSQWVGMGRRLLAEQPVFRAAIESIDALLRPHVPWSLLDELSAPEGRSRLHETEVVQPALFALQVALAALLRSLGVVPDAVIGHSVGELAAAHVAGALSLQEAVRIVAWRGRIMQRATGLGKMAWVELPRDEAAQALAGREALLSLAAVNDPGSVVLSGDAAALGEVLAALRARGVAHRMLPVDYAFHSPQMDALAAELAQALGPVQAQPAAIPFYSTVTGEVVSGAALDAAYWARNVRAPVEFERAVAAASRDGHGLFVEVGPHAVLGSHLLRCLEGQKDRSVICTLRRGGDEQLALLEALGRLFVHGLGIDLGALFPSGGQVVPLPAYPFQRERFWIDPPAAGPAPRRAAGEHPLLGTSFVSALHPEERAWEQHAVEALAPWLSEHRFAEQATFPGSGFLEMALAAGAALYGEGAFELAELRFERVLPLPCATLQLATAAQGERAALTIASRGAEQRTFSRHVTAELRAASRAFAMAEPPAQLAARCPDLLEAEEHYARLLRIGVEHGPGLRSVGPIYLGEREALARVRLPAELLGEAAAYLAHPVLLDGCLQVLMALVLARAGRQPLLPVGLARARLYERLPEQLWVHVRGDERDAQLTALDDSGRVLLEVGGLRCGLVEGASDPFADCVHEVRWQRCELLTVPLPDAPPAVERAPWLVVRDARGFGAELARALRLRGEACEEVDAYGLEELPRLLSGACRGVIHCASLDAAAWEDTTPATLEADLRGGTLGVIALVQALVRRAFLNPPRLFLVTRGAQPVPTARERRAEDAPVAVAQAPLWGLARTLSLEHPELECTRIDLPPSPQPQAAHPGEVERLVRELLEGDGEEQIALRPEGRFVARLVRTRLGEGPASPPVAIRADATYLITGGLGGLGLALAGWLVDKGARHLALVGRSAPSEATRAALRALEDRGAAVRVLRGDVAQAADVEGIVREIREHLPPLRGVVHAAAVLADRTLLQLGAEDFWAPLRPKVLGAWNLHQATRGEPLDFFVLYSSLASLLGSPGQAAYAAGNGFLDALAQARAAAGLCATSIQWGPFTEAGLAAAQDNRGLRLAARGLESFTPAEGTELFGRLLERPPVEVGLFRLSLQRWLESTPQASGMRFLSELPQEPAAELGAARFREELLKAPDAARAALLESHLVEQLGRVLCLAPERIDRHAPFATLGLDSLLSLETRNRLEKSLGLKLPATLFFTYPQVSLLAEHLLERLALPPSVQGHERAPRTAPESRDFLLSPPPPEPPSAPVFDDDALLAAFDTAKLRFDEEITS